MKPYTYLVMGAKGLGNYAPRGDGMHESHHYGTYSDRSYFMFEVLQWIHLLVALTTWVMATIMYFMVFTCTPTLNSNTDETCRSYGTTTFLSTTEGVENRGWPVVTDKANELPATRNNLWPLDPYYTCMQAASIGNGTCSISTPIDVYAACMQSNPLIKTALSTCTGFTGGYFMAWPTGEQFMNCLFNTPLLSSFVQSRKTRNAFQACMSQAVFPFFEAALSPDSTVFMGSFNWGIVGTLGLLGLSFFAVYTGSPFVAGKVHFGKVGSVQKLGAYWGAGLTLISTVVLVVSFILFWSSTTNQYVNVTTGLINFSVLGMLVAYFALEWMDFWGGKYQTPSERMPNKWMPHKWGSPEYVDITNPRQASVDRADKIQEARDEERRRQAHHERESENRRYEEEVRRRQEQANRQPGTNWNKARNAYQQWRGAESALDKGIVLEVPGQLGLMPNEGDREYSVDLYNVDAYTSPLLAIWSDGYAICDSLVWLGLAGATGQLTTDYAWNMFTLVILYRVNNANIARLLYECFHTDKVDNKTLEEFKTKHAAVMDPHQPKNAHGGSAYQLLESGVGEAYLDLKVLALSLQLANALFFTALIIVVFNPQQLTAAPGTPFFLFVILGFIVPEGLRLLMHLYCQFKFSEHHGLYLLLVHQFIFLWDLIVRMIIFWVVVWWGDTNNLFGTRGFLHSEYSYVMISATNFFAP
jgi:hypothetical protein